MLENLFPLKRVTEVMVSFSFKDILLNFSFDKLSSKIQM